MHALINHLVSLAAQLGSWGYVIIFFVVMLECQALLGLFIPGESMVLITGFLAGQGVFNLEALVIAIAAGAIAGDSIGYELGRHLGRTWLLRHGARVGASPERVRRVDAFMQRHGGKAVFAGHFMHVLRALMPFTAGTNRMRYWRFLAFNAAGCVLWACVFCGAGFYLGQSWRVFEKWIGRAGIAVGLLVVLAAALAWLWVWLVRNEQQVKARWRALMGRPGVVRFRSRFAREIAFVERRLKPGGYLGLHLTIGAAIFVAAAWWFGGVVQDLISRDPLISVDHRLAAWFHVHATPGLTRAAQLLSGLGSYVVAVGMLAAITWFAARKSWHRLWAVVLAVGGGALLNLAVKQIFQRQRPAFNRAAVLFPTYSFPSDHVMAATLFYGLLAFLVMQSVREWRWRLLAPFVALFLILVVALTRLYLDAHYLSDVLGAMALGLMWLSFSVTAVEIDRRYRHPR